MIRHISRGLAVLGIMASVSTPSFPTVRSQAQAIPADQIPAGSCPVIDARDGGANGAAGRPVGTPARAAGPVSLGADPSRARQGC